RKGQRCAKDAGRQSLESLLYHDAVMKLLDPAGHKGQDFRMGHLVEHLIEECVAENAIGLCRVDTTALQVKQRLLIQLADSGAMGALDVIGIDLQLWLGIHRSEERRVGKECRSRWAPGQERKRKRTEVMIK